MQLNSLNWHITQYTTKLQVVSITWSSVPSAYLVFVSAGLYSKSEVIVRTVMHKNYLYERELRKKL